MAKARRTYSTADELALTTQVGGHCPLCGVALFYKKQAHSHKDYELAHIYPLNPRPDEARMLDGVQLLHPDVNHPDNIIPLCTSCHTRYDKPRTVAEYDSLAAIKRDLLAKASIRAIITEYPLEADLNKIISRLHDLDFSGGSDAA